MNGDRLVILDVTDSEVKGARLLRARKLSSQLIRHVLKMSIVINSLMINANNLQKWSSVQPTTTKMSV
jgi:hypothetical protein